MRRSLSPARLAFAVFALALGALPARAATLYDALGGNAGLTCMVDAMFVRNLADPRIQHDFDDIAIPRLKARIVAHFCTVSGGPCAFKGVSMKGSHAYLHITQAQFNALVENLQDAMDQCGVGNRTQNRLLAILAPMEHDVVTQ